MKEISLYYDCSLQLFLVTLTVCQCGPCTHILNNGRIYSIFCCPYLLYTLTTFHAVYFRFPSQLQWSWLFPSHTHSSHVHAVCLYNIPLSAFPPKYSLTISFPKEGDRDVFEDSPLLLFGNLSIYIINGFTETTSKNSYFCISFVWNIRYELSGKSLWREPRHGRKCTLLLKHM